MDYSDSLDELYGAPRYRGLRDYHLRSALSSSNLRSTEIANWDYALKAECRKFEENFKIIDRDPCKILGQIFVRSILIAMSGKEFMCAGRSLISESTIYPGLEVPLLREAGERLQRELIRTKYLFPSRYLQQAVIITNALNARKELPPYISRSLHDEHLEIVTTKSEMLGLTLKIGSECFVAVLEDGYGSIHAIDHLRNWSDKCTERLNIELASIFGNLLSPIIYPPPDTVYEFWNIWDVGLLEWGNTFYKCVKVFEAVAVGVLLEKNPNSVIRPESSFLRTTIGDFEESLGNNYRPLYLYLTQMVDFLMNIRPENHISQFYGLYRIWGHPVVNPSAGIAKYRRIATAPKVISEVLTRQIRRIFMTKYSVWYKRTKGAYPNIRLENANADGSNRVFELIMTDSSADLIEEQMLSVDWDSIRFERNIEIPQTFNLAEMVADKAVSPDLSALVSIVKRGKGMYDANLRRGVLQWLLRDPEPCAEFLERVNREGLTRDECIIGLYQKEREVNETPRMFSLMSYAIRNFMVTTESMLSEDILPAFPSITMTNSLLSLQKKIYSVSSKQAQNISQKGFRIYKDVTIIVNIDFEKWNLNFRRATTYPLFEAIGDLYGLPNLYNRTYDVFEGSLIYLADGSYRPRLNDEQTDIVEDGDLCYRGHTGGFEGLRQKGWTIFTDCGLELICQRHKCSHSIMGQGDNQVLILTWKTYDLLPDRSVSERGKRRLTESFQMLMRDLVCTFGELGLPVKALETWSSENLFLYGKIPTLKGVPLAMSLKKLCRAYYLANEEIMTLDCSVATIQSNAMAACMSDITSFVPYVIYKIQLLIALSAYWDYHVLLGEPAFGFITGDNWRFSTSAGTVQRYEITRLISKWKFLMLLSIFPKILGGISVQGWYSFLMRGFGDKVCESLTWIKHSIDNTNDIETRETLRRIYQCHINPEKNFVLLIEDPCSLNLVVPVDSRASVKQSVQELFENLEGVRNQEFSSLFKYNNEWDKSSFCAELCKGEILHPRFLHDVAAATIGGYIDSVVSKVSKASTINKIALRSSKKNPGGKIQQHEKNYMAYLRWKLTPSEEFKSLCEHRCPTEQARALRMLSWDKLLEGVTVPHPMAFLVMIRCTENPESYEVCDRNYISVSLSEEFCRIGSNQIFTLGNSPPYLGSETKEKIGSDPNRQVFGKEPLISRPLRLLRVVNWFVPRDSHAKRLIDRLLTSVSDLNPDDYVSREMGVTGSEAHRYRDQALKHGVMSSNMYTLGSHMHISTDPWVKYTRGAENYTINYQAILCSLQALVGAEVLRSREDHEIPLREYHFHESCTSCIEPLTEEFHDLPDDAIMQLVPSSPDNPYLWVNEATLVLKYLNDPLLNMRVRELSLREYQIFVDKRAVATDWISNSILEDISGSVTMESQLRLLDSQDYPRVIYKKLSVRELWETVARDLIADAGVRYTAKDNTRVAMLSKARDLAADDLMKASPGSCMGLAMFYTWPEKFSEIYDYDNSSVFPDSNPPTLSGSCIASQMNLRNIIRTVMMNGPEGLVISRVNRHSELTIRRYWYKSFFQENRTCSTCLKMMMRYEFELFPLIDRALRCPLGHLVFSRRMLMVSFLTASLDRVVKDCIPFRMGERAEQLMMTPRLESPATTELVVPWNAADLGGYQDRVPIVRDTTWNYACGMPTSSFVRILETLGCVRGFSAVRSSNGVIFGDGLGMTSRVLATEFPETEWICASLQDSERAIPQSYPHALIPENPCPAANLNYLVTKVVYNDLTLRANAYAWKNWISGGTCWCEAEIKEEQIAMVNNLILMGPWELIILRLECGTFETLTTIVQLIGTYSRRMQLWLLGSFAVDKLEVLILAEEVSQDIFNNLTLSAANLQRTYIVGVEELNIKARSMLYAGYLAGIEDHRSISQMIRRVDYWFARVGITHLLSCSGLFTPLWWDIQTGLIPRRVKDLGENKTYYMYKSDLIALQARLISLSISLVSNSEECRTETSKFQNWQLNLETTSKGHLSITLKRGRAVDYGDDNESIIKFIPILRKLNSVNNRWWTTMPNKITFITNKKKMGLWISNLANMSPPGLAELEV